MFTDSFKYVTDKEPKVRSLFWGTVVGFLYLLVIGIPYLLGYYTKSIHHILDGAENRPSYKHKLQTLHHGIYTAVIILSYVGFPVIGLLFLDRVINNSLINTGANANLILVFISILMLTFIFALYLIPSAITQYAKNYNIQRSFEFKTVVYPVLSKTYFKVFIQFIVLTVSLLGLAQLLISILSIFGIPLSGFLVFTYFTSLSYLFAKTEEKYLNR